MPRIRTLKPEHKSHRKVGPLSDRAYRLWVGLITEADDAGRLAEDVRAFRSTIFAYQTLAVARVQAALEEILAKGTLVKRYEHEGQPYLYFPSWEEHQKIDRPRASSLPPPFVESAATIRRTVDDASTLARARIDPTDRIDLAAGEERSGEERLGRLGGSDRPGAGSEPEPAGARPDPPRLASTPPASRSPLAGRAVRAVPKGSQLHRPETAGLPRNGQGRLPKGTVAAVLLEYRRLFADKHASPPVLRPSDSDLVAELLRAHDVQEIYTLLGGFFRVGTAWVRRDGAYSLRAFRHAYSDLLSMRDKGEFR